MRTGCRSLQSILAVAVLATFATGCRSSCQECSYEPCGVPQTCCPQSGCGYTTIEVLGEECCEKERWWKKCRLFGKKDECCECPAPRHDYVGNCLQAYRGNACGSQPACESGPACQCEPKRYSGCGYDSWRDKRAVIEAADECACDALSDHERRNGKVCRDFCCGFRCGYRTVALGGDARVPAVPPKCYWQASERTEGGHDRAGRWFEGYELGARNAQHDGQQPYRRIATPRHEYGDAPAGPPHGEESFTPHGPIEGANPFPTERPELPTPVETSWKRIDDFGLLNEAPVDAVNGMAVNGVDDGLSPSPAVHRTESDVETVHPPLWPH